MEIRKVHIDQLNPSEYNPRKDLQADDPQYQSLQRAIDEFGYVDPIIWNERSGNIVGGHQRLKVLIERGLTEIEVSVVDLDDIKEKALNVALNKISGSWDTEKLSSLFQELQTEMSDFTATGFTDIEIEDLLADCLINIDNLFESAAPKEEKLSEPEKIQCPHCSEWFEVNPA